MLFTFLRWVLFLMLGCLLAWTSLGYGIDDQAVAQKITAFSQERIRHEMNRNYSPQTGQLYYFVSFSMSDSLIKSYAREAARNKGVVVLRGISTAMNLHDFIAKKLWPLLQSKEWPAAAAIEINPNLFEQYKITRVPSLVFSLASAQHCQSVGAAGICQALDERLYWKLSGPVTMDWAMAEFKHSIR